MRDFIGSGKTVFRLWRLLVLLCLTVAGAGCLQVQQDMIIKGRFKYTEAIRDSWEEQMLFNIVSLRYGGATAFLDVESLITQYGIETTGGILGGRGDRGFNTFLGNLSAVRSERPTITYAPLEGRAFALSMLTPISPAEVFGLINAGWNAERSLRLILKSVNALSATHPGTRDLHPDFLEVLQAFKELQDQGALGIRQDYSEETVRTFVYLQGGGDKPAVQEAARILGDSLRIGPEFIPLAFDPAHGLEIVFGPYLGDPSTVTLQTHSVMDILVDIAAFIAVPEEHVREGRTQRNLSYDERDPLTRPPVRILTSHDEPEAAMVSLHDRDTWFYIDDRDIESKKSFSFLMILRQLQASHEAGRRPLVTIGTGK
jgi:hypothetical protein